MPINVELFGVARSRAGTSAVMAEGNCLGDVLADLATRLPALADACIDGRRLRSGFVANVAGDRFVTDPATPLTDGEALLILSLDAGG